EAVPCRAALARHGARAQRDVEAHGRLRADPDELTPRPEPASQSVRRRKRRPVTKLRSTRTNRVATPESNAHGRGGLAASAARSAGSTTSVQTPWTMTLQPHEPSAA